MLPPQGKDMPVSTRKNAMYNVAYRVFSVLLPLVTAVAAAAATLWMAIARSLPPHPSDTIHSAARAQLIAAMALFFVLLQR